MANARQYTGDINETFSIIKTKDNQIFGYHRTIQGNAILWDSGNGQRFFNYKKNEFFTDIDAQLFFEFLKLYHSKDKFILKKSDW
ncbi:MAG: hypothetical protein H6553_06740 [Chitinophagales bacterium]|nr:hypothetical protein [Chitinophagales bacterium]